MKISKTIYAVLGKDGRIVSKLDDKLTGWIPLVFSDPGLVEQIKDYMQNIADASLEQIKLCKYEYKETIKLVKPQDLDDDQNNTH